MYNGITTAELDELSSNICASFITQHPLYNNLGAKISISNLHKKTLDSFSDKIKLFIIIIIIYQKIIMNI